MLYTSQLGIGSALNYKRYKTVAKCISFGCRELQKCPPTVAVISDSQLRLYQRKS